MFIFGNLFIALAQVVNVLLTILYWLLIVRILISWVNPDPYNSIVQFLRQTTDPILEPLRRLMPPIGGFDISPIFAFIAIIFLKSFLVQTLMQIGYSLR
jgi:YggT family protein